jgi:hypothetical protein
MPGDSATNRIPAVDHTRSHALPAARERSATESVEHAGAGSSARADCEPTGGQRAGTGEQRERMQGCSQLHDSHWSSGCRSPAFHCCSASSCALPSAPPPPLATAMSAAPTQMKAILLKKPGGPANIEYGDAPKPTPKANELLVKIYGTAINRADTLQRCVCEFSAAPRTYA